MVKIITKKPVLHCKSLQSPFELFWTAKYTYLPASDRKLDRMSDRMSDQMSDRMSDQLSDRLSDRISLNTWEYHF